MALTTFVGQNLGAKEYERTKKGARFGILCCIISAEVIGVLMVLFARPLMEAFTKEQAAVDMGIQRAMICTWFFCLLACSHAVSAVLRGAGRALIPMLTMLAFWCVVRVAFLTITIPILHSSLLLHWVYPLTWALSTVTLLIYYFKADWIHGFEDEHRHGLKNLFRRGHTIGH